MTEDPEQDVDSRSEPDDEVPDNVLDHISEVLKREFGQVKGLEFLAMRPEYESGKHCRVFLRFKTERDVLKHIEDGTVGAIVDRAGEELEHTGLSRSDIVVRADLDSEEVFEALSRRANASDRWWHRGLSNAADAVEKAFKRDASLTHVGLFNEMQWKAFRAYLFFTTDREMQRCREDGTLERIVDRIHEELERQGRGKKGDLTLAIEVDSDERLESIGWSHYQRMH